MTTDVVLRTPLTAAAAADLAEQCKALAGATTRHTFEIDRHPPVTTLRSPTEPAPAPAAALELTYSLGRRLRPTDTPNAWPRGHARISFTSGTPGRAHWLAHDLGKWLTAHGHTWSWRCRDAASHRCRAAGWQHGAGDGRLPPGWRYRRGLIATTLAARRLRLGRLTVHLQPRDLWIGAYLARDAVYVCPLPTVVITWRRNPRTARHSPSAREGVA